MPTEKRGRFSAQKCVLWYVRHLQSATPKARNAATSMEKREFAEQFGVSENQLERHFQNGMPHRRESSRKVVIPMPEGRVWFHAHLVSKGKKQAAPKTIDEAKLRTETARADMAELDLMERLKETMLEADHEKYLADAFSRVAAKLTNFASRAAAASFGSLTIEDCERRIAAIVDEIREELRKADDVPVIEDVEEDEDETVDDDAD